VIVTTSLDTHKAIAIPEDLRAAIEPGPSCRLNFEGVREGRIMEVLLPEGWPRPKGYSNGVVARGRQVYIAGMVGWDAQGRFHSDDFAEQAQQALQNIVEVLRWPAASPSTSCA
jgi:hypothetical protein